jgi:L-lactate dehydrogenase complex protein LldG
MSRASMIGRIRAALGTRRTTGAVRARAVAERLAHPPQHPRPALARTEGPEREARLIRCLETQGAEIVAVPDLAALPSAVAALLHPPRPSSPPLVGEDRGGRMRIFIGDDRRLRTLLWPATVAPTRWTPDQTLGDGTAALTHAWGAVAETGTLIMTSSAASPASLAFLPELHIVALARADIAASFEDAFARLGADIGPHRVPRAVNLISSPSRTSDIGGRSVRGAHGPRRLAVILYGP